MPENEAAFRAAMLRKLADVQDMLDDLAERHDHWIARQEVFNQRQIEILEEMKAQRAELISKLLDQADPDDWWRRGDEPPI